MQIIEKSIESIIPYDKNPRFNDEAVKYVAESIQQFGFKVPIIIDKDNVIIAGHTRLKAAKELGYETVPCVLADDLTPEQVKAFRLADNKVAEYSEWDMDLLQSELMEIESIDMESLGFEEMEDLDTAEAVDDGYDPEPPEEPISKPGEIYQLGNHRLMVGDSTKASDVEKLMDGNLADLVVTDPPYNVAIENSQGMKIENDDMDDSAFLKFLIFAFENLEKNLKPGGAFYVWYASREHINFEKALNECGLSVREQLIWNKNTFILGRQDYHWKHEPCLYGWKEGASHYFINDRTQSTVIDFETLEFEKMKKDALIKLLKFIFSEETKKTVIEENKPTVNDLHPTMKPIPLIGKQIRNSSKPGEKILDLFGGSGTTLIACEQMNRKCFMMEYDPKYADVIIDRWEQYTGKKAVLISE